MAIASNDDVFAYLGESTPTAAQIALLTLLKPMAESAVKTWVGYAIEQTTFTHFLPEVDTREGRIESLDATTDRVFFEATDGTERLYLPERPLRSITSLYEDAAAYAGQGASDFAAATLLTAGTDFYIDYTTSGVSWSGLVVKIAGTWPSRRRTVKVTYSAGLSAAELAGTTSVSGPNGVGVGQLKLAAIIASAIAFRQHSSVAAGVGGGVGPVQSERLADYSVTYGKSVDNLFGFGTDLPDGVKRLLEPFKRYDI